MAYPPGRGYEHVSAFDDSLSTSSHAPLTAPSAAARYPAPMESRHVQYAAAGNDADKVASGTSTRPQSSRTSSYDILSRYGGQVEQTVYVDPALAKKSKASRPQGMRHSWLPSTDPVANLTIAHSSFDCTHGSSTSRSLPGPLLSSHVMPVVAYAPCKTQLASVHRACPRCAFPKTSSLRSPDPSISGLLWIPGILGLTAYPNANLLHTKLIVRCPFASRANDCATLTYLINSGGRFGCLSCGAVRCPHCSV